MTRKKIYICFALLFCVPTALLSTEIQPECALIGVYTKGNNKPYAVFAPSSVSAVNIYKCLDYAKKTITSIKGDLQGEITELRIYTKNDAKEGITIWSTELQNEYNMHDSQDDSEDDSDEVREPKAYDVLEKILFYVAKENGGFAENYTVEKLEDLEEECQTRVDEKKEKLKIKLPQNKFRNVYENENPENNKIRIIERDDKSNLNMKDVVDYIKGPHVLVKTIAGKFYTIGDARGVLTVKELKEKISEKISKNKISPEQFKLVYAGKELQDNNQLSYYSLPSIDAVITLVYRMGRKNQKKKKATNDTPNANGQVTKKEETQTRNENEVQDEDNIDHTNDTPNTQIQLQGQPENKIPKKDNINLTNDASNTQEQQQRINTDNNQNGDESQQNENSNEAPPLYTNPKIILIGICIIGCALSITLNSKQVNNKTKRRHRAKQKA